MVIVLARYLCLICYRLVCVYVYVRVSIKTIELFLPLITLLKIAMIIVDGSRIDRVVLVLLVDMKPFFCFLFFFTFVSIHSHSLGQNWLDCVI